MIINGARMTPSVNTTHSSQSLPTHHQSMVKNVQFVRTHSNSSAGPEQEEAGGEPSQTETEKTESEEEELYIKGKQNQNKPFRQSTEPCTYASWVFSLHKLNN